MKIIFKIAWLELKTLFSSPIAWLLLIIFTVQGTLDLTGALKGAIIRQMQYTTFNGEPIGAYLTERLFGISVGAAGIFSAVIGRWYLYIPLLTMGLISRELSSGNIKLLFSSPVKIREIVWGKFLGIMGYWTLLMGILLLLVLCSRAFVTGFDFPVIFSCFLGVYLLAMLYSAIGLFVSCLTIYQIIAAIGTFIVLGALDYFGSMWQGIPFLRDVTWFINTGAHTGNLLRGLIISRDIIYFLSLTLMFILFSMMTLQDKVHHRSIMLKISRYVLVACTVLLCGYLVTRPKLTWYADVTQFKSNTLTPASQKVLAQLKGPVTITIFDNLFNNNSDIGNPDHVNNNIQDWEPYKLFLPELEIKYVHFYAPVSGNYPGYPEVSIKKAAVAEAKQRGLDINRYISPDSIRKVADLSPYENKTVMRISNNNKEVFLRNPRSFSFDFLFEEYMMANLVRMINGADTIAFLSGNGERSIENDGERDYKRLIFDHNYPAVCLTDNGFEAFSHNPSMSIPAKTNILVIADPAKYYSDTAQQHIRDYITRGANLILAKGDHDAGILEQLTKPLGVEFIPGSLVQPNKKASANHIIVNLIRSSLQDTTYFHKEWNKVPLTDVTALKYQQGGPFKIEPVLLTDEKTTWNKRLESTLDTGKLDFHPEQGDDHSRLPAAVVLTRDIKGKQQRILIIGNAGFMIQKEGDFYFKRTIFNWLSYGKFPLNKLRKDPAENFVKLTYKQADALEYWLIIISSVVFIIWGSIYLSKRRSL